MKGAFEKLETGKVKKSVFCDNFSLNVPEDFFEL